MGNKEFESSVQPFPQEVLTRMFYHLDAPSLVKVGSVQKEWSRIILATSSLFHNFEMKGKGHSILEGLRKFQTRSDNKVQRVEIEIRDKMSEELKESLVEVINQSSDHLQYLRSLTMVIWTNPWSELPDSALHSRSLTPLESKCLERDYLVLQGLTWSSTPNHPVLKSSVGLEELLVFTVIKVS